MRLKFVERLTKARTRWTAAGVVAAAIVAMAVSPAGGLASTDATAQPGDPLTLVDTLGTATPTTTFDFAGSGGWALFAEQKVGPRFVLTRPTAITEIGGIVNNCEVIFMGVPQCPDTAPLVVQIVPVSVDGLPDVQNVLATLVLSHDNDPLTFSYESVNPNLQLDAGTYFALFGAQNKDVGHLLAIAPGYAAGVTTMGLWVAWWPAPAVQDLDGAVRILGRLALPTSKEQCKNDGWRDYPQFKNEGDCVSFVAGGKEE
jgi:hypothetical protein